MLFSEADFESVARCELRPLGPGIFRVGGGPEITDSTEGAISSGFYETNAAQGGLAIPFFVEVPLTFIELLLFASVGHSAAY